MKTLLMDTSSANLLVYFLEDENIVYTCNKEGQNHHSDCLLDEIELGLKTLQWEVKDLNRIFIGDGPGAYTGLRVSMTIGKMFAWTLHIPLFTISSLDILFSGYYQDNGIHAIMLKAKKEYSYTKIIEVTSGKIKILQEESFTSNESFMKKLSLFPKAHLITNENILPNPLLIQKEQIKKVDHIHALEPNYLRGAF